MDDHVLRGMAKWPDVPAVYGWLSLDRRGHWLIKGEPVSNTTVIAYIGRNYERDGDGCWFFQNGPQRVFVELEYTPFVYRAVNAPDAPLALQAHTGAPVTALSGAWVDEDGALLLETEHGVGVMLDRDLDAVLPAMIDANGSVLPEDALERAMTMLQQGQDAPVWVKLGEANVKVHAIRVSEVPQRFGFAPRPADPANNEAAVAATR